MSHLPAPPDGDARRVQIPLGEFCYDCEYVPANPQTNESEYWLMHSDRRCPFWRRTDHATVCCDFLGIEDADEAVGGYPAIIEAHFGGAEEARKHVS